MASRICMNWTAVDYAIGIQVVVMVQVIYSVIWSKIYGFPTKWYNLVKPKISDHVPIVSTCLLIFKTMTTHTDIVGQHGNVLFR